MPPSCLVEAVLNAAAGRADSDEDERDVHDEAPNAEADDHGDHGGELEYEASIVEENASEESGSDVEMGESDAGHEPDHNEEEEVNMDANPEVDHPALKDVDSSENESMSDADTLCLGGGRLADVANKNDPSSSGDIDLSQNTEASCNDLFESPACGNSGPHRNELVEMCISLMQFLAIEHPDIMKSLGTT